MTKKNPKTIRTKHIVHPADGAWRPTRLQRAFGDPLPRALATHRDDTGAVPGRVVQHYLAQLRREALGAFERHSELIPGNAEQRMNGRSAQKEANP